jgi:hypothetical protein
MCNCKKKKKTLPETEEKLNAAEKKIKLLEERLQAFYKKFDEDLDSILVFKD